MTPKLLTALALSLSATTTAQAAPLWEQSDRWTCDLELYFSAKTDGTRYTNLDADSLSITFDFVEGTQSSVFVETPGKIVNKHYVEGDYGAYNALSVDWGAGIIQVNLIEDGGEVWMPTVSNFAGGVPWFANYKCEPET
ncbi:MAG: hypothetical protein ACRBCL_03225 [Maritimibacter sp.]